MGVFSPQIYYFNNRYYLFYGGSDGSRAATGLAVSESLESGWERVSAGPVLAPGNRGDWDEMNALIVSLIELDDCYCAFYEGEDRHKKYRIGVAYSMDLVKWIKWNGNPVIDIGPPGSYNELMVCGPRAFFNEEKLYLFFNTHRKDMSGHCGLAVFNNNL